MKLPDLLGASGSTRVRRGLLQHGSTCCQRTVLQEVDLAGAQGRKVGRLILEDAVDQFVDERQLELGCRRTFRSQ